MRVSKRYQFEFRHPVERLWAVVSDIPRRGEALGMRIAWEEPPVAGFNPLANTAIRAAASDGG